MICDGLCGRYERSTAQHSLTGDEPIRDYTILRVETYHYVYLCEFFGWLYNSSHVVYKVRKYDIDTFRELAVYEMHLSNDFYCMGTTYDFHSYTVRSDRS